MSDPDDGALVRYQLEDGTVVHELAIWLGDRIRRVQAEDVHRVDDRDYEVVRLEKAPAGIGVSHVLVLRPSGDVSSASGLGASRLG